MAERVKIIIYVCREQLRGMRDYFNCEGIEVSVERGELDEEMKFTNSRECQHCKLETMPLNLNQMADFIRYAPGRRFTILEPI